MESERSTSAHEHFYTHDLQCLFAQLQAARKHAKQWLSQDIDAKAEEARVKMERLRIKVGASTNCATIRI